MPRSGIRYSESYAWEEAARWRGYDRETFDALLGDDQARIVAHWETSMQIEAVLAQDLERRRRQANRPKKTV